MMDAVQIEDITKYYRKYSKLKSFHTIKSAFVRDLWKKNSNKDRGDYFYALRDISLNIPQGVTLGIIGANGAGKSTLLKIITGLTSPSKGKIKTNGRISSLIELGTGFHPEISGRENIFVNGIMLGLTKKQIKEKFDEIVEFSELGEFIDNPIKTYSSGMLMRLGFTVAVNVDPDILIVDEVLSVGDISFSRKCNERIANFKTRGKTIILVTHDLGMVNSLCDEAVLLEKGRLIERGESRRVVDAYLMQVLKKDEENIKKKLRKTSEVINEGDVKKTELPSLEQITEKDGASTLTGVSDKQISAQVTQNGSIPTRWGSKEIEIESVIFKNIHGEERFVFVCGEGMIAEIKFKVNEAISEPVFGIGIYRP
ncbi:ABC transporter ATP-binding protein, partial [bacterium]|nr:ABC transporter ATP-binding protein [bacterium]